MEERPKRPYQRPTLEGASVFGAEAMAGSCCRTSPGACSNATRDTQRLTNDPSKVRVSAVS
jgi:hypothetical protein